METARPGDRRCITFRSSVPSLQSQAAGLVTSRPSHFPPEPLNLLLKGSRSLSTASSKSGQGGPWALWQEGQWLRTQERKRRGQAQFWACDPGAKPRILVLLCASRCLSHTQCCGVAGSSLPTEHTSTRHVTCHCLSCPHTGMSTPRGQGPCLT